MRAVRDSASDTGRHVSKILIVDDESSLRFVLKLAFELAGHDVVEAQHGAAALERVGELRPDVVVTDFMMPVMDGGELISRLRANPETTDIPIVLVTASAIVAGEGVDVMLRKPFEPEHVVATAESLVRRER